MILFINSVLILFFWGSYFLGYPLKDFDGFSFGSDLQIVKSTLEEQGIHLRESQGGIPGASFLSHLYQKDGLYFNRTFNFTDKKLTGGFLVISSCPVDPHIDSSKYKECLFSRDSLYQVFSAVFLLFSTKPIKNETNEIIYKLSDSDYNYRFITLTKTNDGIPAILYKNLLVPKHVIDSLENIERIKIEGNRIKHK